MTFVGVEVVLAVARVHAVVPEVHGAVRDDLVRDDARPVVQHVRDVAQRAQMRLGRLELAERDRRERRVLAVGGEQPRIVREARAEPRDAAHRPERRRELLAALVGPADLQVLGRLRRVGEVLLAPLDRVLEQLVAGQRHAREARQRGARGLLDRERTRRIAQRAGQLGLRRVEPLIGARGGDPERLGALRRDLDRVGQLAAGALAVRAVVARARRRRAVVVRAHGAGLRSAEVAARLRGLAGVRRAVGRDERGVVVLRRAVAERAVVGEHERRAVERALVGQVVARVGLAAVRIGTPRPVADQLRVRVDLHLDGLVGAAGVLQLEPEQRRAAAVGHEVGAAQLQPARVGQLVTDVPAAAGELRGRPDPLVADAEPDAVEHLHRRGPDAAHLTVDVPAVRVEPAVREPEHVRARPRRDLAAILQAIARRQLRGGLGARRSQ